MRNQRTKKAAPWDEHARHYLKIAKWHAAFHGPTWRREDIPHAGWRSGLDWIEHKFEVEDEEILSLELLLVPYRQVMAVKDRVFDQVDFKIYSSSKPGSGLLTAYSDQGMRGWLSTPLPGVQSLLTLLAGGSSVIVEIHCSGFKRREARVYSDCGWSTEGHPALEDELA